MLEPRALLVALAVGASLVVPAELAPAAGTPRAVQFTVWPGNSARFANLDWTCEYPLKRDVLGNVHAVFCHRRTSDHGIEVNITGDYVRVFDCTSRFTCTELLKRPRTP